MKVVYEPGEIERIEIVHAEITKDGWYKGLFPDSEDKIYGLTFKVTNPALAEYILSG